MLNCKENINQTLSANCVALMHGVAAGSKNLLTEDAKDFWKLGIKM